jgi:predicted O-methyltransferase YrrM
MSPMNSEAIHRLLKRRHRGCYLKLLSYFHEIEVHTIAEIGVFQGKNALVLKEMFPKAHLYLIDPWEPLSAYLESETAVSQQKDVYAKAYSRVQTLFKDDPLVTILKKGSSEAISDITDLLDLVFIDANHTYDAVKRDILLWKDKVRSGGILSGHNYGRLRLPGVKKAVDELFDGEFFLGQDEVWAYLLK